MDYLDLRVRSSERARFVLFGRGDYLPGQAMQMLSWAYLFVPSESIDRAHEERILSSKLGEA